MNQNIKKMTITSLCIGLGLILPSALHMIPNAGSIFLPMHIPILLCGLLCGPIYGGFAGIITPFLSSTLTSMPPAPILPGMMCELFTYGLVSGLACRYIQTKNKMLNIYLSLMISMICGRLMLGMLNSLIFMVGNYSLQIFLTTSFIRAIPGIVIQLAFLPSIVYLLKYKVKVI